MNFLLQTVDKKIVHDFGFALTQSKDYINKVLLKYNVSAQYQHLLRLCGLDELAVNFKI